MKHLTRFDSTPTCTREEMLVFQVMDKIIRLQQGFISFIFLTDTFHRDSNVEYHSSNYKEAIAHSISQLGPQKAQTSEAKT